MNFRTVLTLAALAIPTTLIACAADATDEPSDSSENDLTGRQQLQGSWVSDPTVDESTGLDLRPSGQFFWDVASRRTEGSYTVNKSAKTLTTKVDGRETVYRYIYTPAPVINGFPGPGGFPRTFARLELQQLRPMTIVAVSHKFVQADSYCSHPVDCMLEQQDKTWTPAEKEGTPTCGANHSCQLKSSATDTVVASCGPVHILNGFPNPNGIFTAEISMHAPQILNGFVRPSFKVVVKQGDNVQATLDNCTGNLDQWNLHCTPKGQALGVVNTFDLSDKPNEKGTFRTGPLSPTAPVFSHDFRCTLED